jgi:RNA polymerase sigma factor (sigma-70 family)
LLLPLRIVQPRADLRPPCSQLRGPHESTTLRTKLLDAPTDGVLRLPMSVLLEWGSEGGQSMSEAPDPRELATTQLLPYLAVGGNEEAWRAFVVRYRPRILRWCRRLQADDAEEVTSRVLHKLVVGLARGVYRRHDPGTFRGWLRRVVANEVVDLARRQRSGRSTVAVLSCWPDPVSVDELAGEIDLEFRADCERAEQVCTRVRGRVQPHTWEAFIRTYLQGQDVCEVARDLGLTLSGVYKARDRVRRLLEEEGQAESAPAVGSGLPP